MEKRGYVPHPLVMTHPRVRTRPEVVLYEIVLSGTRRRRGVLG